MRKTTVIWIIYILGILSVFVLSSCSSSRPKYVASKEVVKAPMENKKRKTTVQVHLITLIWVGIIIHFTNQESK